MSDSSLLSTFTIELVQEVIRQSDIPTLANWCLVSRAFLSFAGPLLYEIVTLSREEDVVPFIIRLNVHLCRYRTDAPPPLLPLNSLKRLHVLVFPSGEAFFKLAKDSRVRVPEFAYDFVLGILWNQQRLETRNGRFQTWAFTLARILRPRRFEELGDEDFRIYLSGTLLDGFRLLAVPGEGLTYLYQGLCSLSRQQQSINTRALKYSIELPESLAGQTSRVLDALVVTFEETKRSLADRSLFGYPDGVFDTLDAMDQHISESRKVLQELKAIFISFHEECASLIKALLLELKAQDAEAEALGSRLSELRIG